MKNIEIPVRRKLGLHLLRTFNWSYDQSQLFFAHYELTSQQYNVLKILHMAAHPLSTSEILEQMEEKNAGVSRLVDRLVLKGYVSKTINPADKRLVAVSITAAGLERVKKVDRNLDKLDLVYAALNDQEVAQLSKLLEKIRTGR
ncbi:MarR family winged helix-turn-helix transcriptional regulator [Chitinophaga varians]|uniref:MarR family winged helix-turn-helix transcriptional regulator n=1 Tax=Chitinophaga varians TaxID=2202339 RepID=UPI00165F39E4|nr:MarR family transcriptional regulator [Chitinophaga varians]MBC9909618.1 MarR family transcriptional regulator [Chitinophaga varians]